MFAVADGKVAKLFDGKPGGLTVYQFDASEKFACYSAHLDRYASFALSHFRTRSGEAIVKRISNQPVPAIWGSATPVKAPLTTANAAGISAVVFGRMVFRPFLA